MDDKIKRLATNLSELIPDPKEPQEVWDSLRFLMKEQREYFQRIPPENTIKLIFYIWSLKETGNFKLGEKMLNEISFAVLFTHEGNYHRETCSECDGEGDLDCNECNGGRISCEQCDGDGRETCSECGGSGDIQDDGENLTCPDCGGEGELDCGECQGEGEVDCPNCNYGRISCDECSGDGEIETEAYDYYAYLIVTWDNPIKSRCEITENDSEPTMSEYDFDRLKGDFIILSMDENHADFKEWVDENEMYCGYYNDNPKLRYSDDMEIFTNEDNSRHLIHAID